MAPGSLTLHGPTAHAGLSPAGLLPLGQLANHSGTLPRDRTIIVVCRSGRRSAEAVRTVQAPGLASVHNLAGGMIAWRRAGLPTAE